eukprot:gene9953-10108_t
MPSLEILKLSGLGGFYGWHGVVRHAAKLTGFPKLHTLHIGCAMLQLPSGLLRRGSSDINDQTLLQLAGKSCLLKDLDISGSHVTTAGFMALAESLAKCSAEKAASARSALATTQAPKGGNIAAKVEAIALHNSLLTAAGRAPQTTADGVASADGESELVAVSGQPSAVSVDRALKLQRLYISHCEGLARDDGLMLIGQLCGPCLQELVVRNAGASIGDVGVRGLACCLNLTSLDITSSSVTEQGGG